MRKNVLSWYDPDKFKVFFVAISASPADGLLLPSAQRTSNRCRTGFSAGRENAGVH
jgi:hypothetical protein